MASAAGVDGGCDAVDRDDAELIARLQKALKPKRGPMPKPTMVAAALALARDKSMLPAAACKGLPAGSHTRATILRDRILREGLLDATIEPST